jgi:uncharacterized membrane protein YecN with MAPEG domain
MKYFIAIDVIAIVLLALTGAPIWLVAALGLFVARQVSFHYLSSYLKAKSFQQIDSGPNVPGPNVPRV